MTEACSVARSLQPAIVAVEDVDLIAERREARPGEHPLLFQLLNEMDGLNSAADATFLLTTPPASASSSPPASASLSPRSPPVPGGSAVIEPTDGVIASFLKELLRKAALLACEDDADGDGAIRVTDAHMSAALDRLFDSRSQLTRVLPRGEQPTATGDKGTLDTRA